MAYQLGVDLGTTFTAAAVARGGRAELVTLGTSGVTVPSVLYLTGEELLIGDPAERRAATDPSGVAREFKRRLGDPTPIMVGGAPVAADLLMARLLDRVVQQVTATEGAMPGNLIVTHPANWGQYKLDLLDQAARHVGLSSPGLLPEPVAAATFYASQRDLAPGSVVAVYDLGGGTFDAAVVRSTPDGFEIVGQPQGIERLGGIDFDHAVLRHVSDAARLDLEAMAAGGEEAEDPALVTAMAQLRQECVRAKEALSAETDVSVPVMFPDRHTRVRLTRSEFEAMIRPSLRESIVALRRAVESAGLTPDEVSAVLLVGGSSRVPLVGQLVSEELGRPIAVDARPKDAICLGAALSTAGQSPDVDEIGPSAPIPAPGVPTPVATDPALDLAPAASATEAAQADVGVPAASSTGPGRSRTPFVIAGIAAAAVVAGVGAWLLASDGDGDEADAATSEVDPADSTTSTSSTTSTTADAAEQGTGETDGGEAPGSRGEIEIATIPWDESIAVTALWQTLLTEQGYEVERTESDLGAVFPDLADGEVDLFLDAWLPDTHGSFMDEHGASIDQLSSWNDGATLHLAVPDYVDAEIDSIADLVDHAGQFDNRIVGIDPEAGLTTAVRDEVMPAYGLDDLTLADRSAPLRRCLRSWRAPSTVRTGSS